MGNVVYNLSATTQGPLYPPSEAMDQEGNFVVVGRVNRAHELGKNASWGAVIVSPDNEEEVPEFGEHAPYNIVEELDLSNKSRLNEIILHTLPVPLPMNNYRMIFAPEQYSNSDMLVTRESLPFHRVPYPDERYIDGPKRYPFPITLCKWLEAKGTLEVSWRPGNSSCVFDLNMSGLIPNSLYTVMTLRAWDLRAEHPSRPGPLGIPNVFITDSLGNGHYTAELPDPFPAAGNRVINVIVLWMSEQRNYGGAIGRFGLGGDIHAQLKIQENTFYDIDPLVEEC